MQRTAAKFISAIAGAYTAVMHDVPDMIETAIWILVAFVMLDTVTGVWVSARCRKLASKHLTEKLITKGLQYAIILAIAGGAALMAKAWVVFGGGVAVLVCIETLSLLENLSVLEANGGAPLGPARPFLAKIAKYLAVNQETAAQLEQAAQGNAPIGAQSPGSAPAGGQQ